MAGTSPTARSGSRSSGSRPSSSGYAAVRASRGGTSRWTAAPSACSGGGQRIAGKAADPGRELTRRPQIAVIGRGAPHEELGALAEEVGRGIAERGAVLVCGGMGGVMEAAARGAREAGGDVIGIVPTEDVAPANPYVTHAVATGIGHARNLAVVASADAVIAIGGEWGTLAEIGFARRLG